MRSICFVFLIPCKMKFHTIEWVHLKFSTCPNNPYLGMMGRNPRMRKNVLQIKPNNVSSVVHYSVCGLIKMSTNLNNFILLRHVLFVNNEQFFSNFVMKNCVLLYIFCFNNFSQFIQFPNLQISFTFKQCLTTWSPMKSYDLCSEIVMGHPVL